MQSIRLHFLRWIFICGIGLLEMASMNARLRAMGDVKLEMEDISDQGKPEVPQSTSMSANITE